VTADPESDWMVKLIRIAHDAKNVKLGLTAERTHRTWDHEDPNLSRIFEQRQDNIRGGEYGDVWKGLSLIWSDKHGSCGDNTNPSCQ